MRAEKVTRNKMKDKIENCLMEQNPKSPSRIHTRSNRVSYAIGPGLGAELKGFTLPCPALRLKRHRLELLLHEPAQRQRVRSVDSHHFIVLAVA